MVEGGADREHALGAGSAIGWWFAVRLPAATHLGAFSDVVACPSTAWTTRLCVGLMTGVCVSLAPFFFFFVANGQAPGRQQSQRSPFVAP